ncbi:MAG: dihydropteroate synthase [Cyanobacteriota bacterium]
MLLIGENIHIISKKTRAAIVERNADFIRDLALRQQQSGVDYIDLNIGPAKKQQGTMKWLIETISDIISVPLSLDTTNLYEMEEGLTLLKNKCIPIINSTSGDPERLDSMMPMAQKYNANIICLTLNNISGIPKDPEGRLEIAMQIIEKAMELEIDNHRILLDPLLLPVSVSQDQVMESLNSIRVFKEAFDPPVKTIVGLSNVSNGSPKENRSLINNVFLLLAIGCGLDSAIVNAFDTDLKHIVNVVKTRQTVSESDNLILKLHDMMAEFGDLDDIEYDKNDPEQLKLYKTAQVLLNKNIYAHNYLNI